MFLTSPGTRIVATISLPAAASDTLHGSVFWVTRTLNAQALVGRASMSRPTSNSGLASRPTRGVRAGRRRPAHGRRASLAATPVPARLQTDAGIAARKRIRSSALMSTTKWWSSVEAGRARSVRGFWRSCAGRRDRPNRVGSGPRDAAGNDWPALEVHPGCEFAVLHQPGEERLKYV